MPSPGIYSRFFNRCVWGKPVMEWALSNALRSVCPNDWVLHKSALRLACQGQLSRLVFALFFWNSVLYLDRHLWFPWELNDWELFSQDVVLKSICYLLSILLTFIVATDNFASLLKITSRCCSFLIAFRWSYGAICARFGLLLNSKRALLVPLCRWIIRHLAVSRLHLVS